MDSGLIFLFQKFYERLWALFLIDRSMSFIAALQVFHKSSKLARGGSESFLYMDLITIVKKPLGVLSDIVPRIRKYNSCDYCNGSRH